MRGARSIPAILLVVTFAAACLGPSPRGERAACSHLKSERRVRGVALCESVWTCERPPGGSLDRLGIRRLAPCGDVRGPVTLLFPDRHMSSKTGQLDAKTDLRLYLAQAGVQAWSLDYRSHTASALAGVVDETEMELWDAGTWLADVTWAIAFVRSVLPKPVYLIGVGDGATLAYAAIASGARGIGGIVAIDGGLEPAPAPTDTGLLIEATVGALGWREGSRLVRSARLGSRNPSPIPGFTTAGEALAGVLFDARQWGAPGSLSTSKRGASNPTILARYLAEQDRWWPADVARHRVTETPRRTLPVLAFAAGQRGAAWIGRVQLAAHAFGGEEATVRVLALHGHLDVLLGHTAARRVYERIRRFVTPPDS